MSMHTEYAQKTMMIKQINEHLSPHKLKIVGSIVGEMARLDECDVVVVRANGETQVLGRRIDTSRLYVWLEGFWVACSLIDNLTEEPVVWRRKPNLLTGTTTSGDVLTKDAIDYDSAKHKALRIIHGRNV